MNSLAMLRISITEAATDATADISAVLLGMIFLFWKLLDMVLIKWKTGWANFSLMNLNLDVVQDDLKMPIKGLDWTLVYQLSLA